jgi:hypothetical protein
MAKIIDSRRKYTVDGSLMCLLWHMLDVYEKDNNIPDIDFWMKVLHALWWDKDTWKEQE